jgi:hypothetical protein
LEESSFLGGARRLKLGAERDLKASEFLRVVIGEKSGLRAQAVLQVILADDGLATSGSWPCAFQGVAAISRDLSGLAIIVGGAGRRRMGLRCAACLDAL